MEVLDVTHDRYRPIQLDGLLSQGIKDEKKLKKLKEISGEAELHSLCLVDVLPWCLIYYPVQLQKQWAVIVKLGRYELHCSAILNLLLVLL